MLVVLCSVLLAGIPIARAQTPAKDLEPELSRWRLFEPQGIGEKPRSPLYDPYAPNVVKGDYPLFGDKVFFAATGVLDLFYDFKRNLDFFSGGRFRNVNYNEYNNLGQLTGVLFLDVFQGDTVFTPRDWQIRVAPIIRFRCGDKNAIEQGCGEYITLQEAFAELKLFEIGDTFDATSGRIGIQPFNSDLFGFIFNDVQPGFRLFGEANRNQIKFNVAVFDRLSKEKLVALNELNKRREHQVGVLSLQWDDFILPGFNVQPSFVVSHDNAPGVAAGGTLDAYYIGFATNGRIDRFNVNTALYYAFGSTARNTPTLRSQAIHAGMAFAQVAYPINYFNPRLAAFYATGDRDPRDGTATGFDSVFDNVAFAGGQFSYLFGEKIQLGNTTVLRGNSVYPSLRGANATAQFVNPGVFAVNPGVDMVLTPKTLFEANYVYVQFDDTSSLRAVAGGNVSRTIGHELNAGVTYRPLLNEQLILFAGGAVFLPGQGIKDTFGNDDPVFKAIVRMILTF